MKPLATKYPPKKLNEIIGQDEAVKVIKNPIKGKKALLLYGPPGTGKTCCVYALANETNSEIIEVNASDFRNKDQINSIVGAAAMQRSLIAKSKIILIDEVDGLSGTKDRGGIQALIKIIAESSFPIVITATNPWDKKFSSLRRKCVMVPFQPLDYKSICKILEDICVKESIQFEKEMLSKIARRAGGDARSAINDMQTMITKNKLAKESLDVLGSREKEESILHGLLKIFKTTDPKLAIGAFEHVREDMNEQLLWIDANLPKEYEKPADLARAYDKLSRADVFSRRIRRWQHWRFLVYINALITAGIAVSKDEKYKKFVEYKPTGRILKMWWAKQKSMKKRAIAEKIADKTHTSKREALKSFEYFRGMFRDKAMSNALAKELELDKEEVAWLTK